MRIAPSERPRRFSDLPAYDVEAQARKPEEQHHINAHFAWDAADEDHLFEVRSKFA